MKDGKKEGGGRQEEVPAIALFANFKGFTNESFYCLNFLSLPGFCNLYTKEDHREPKGGFHNRTE